MQRRYGNVFLKKKKKSPALSLSLLSFSLFSFSTLISFCNVYLRRRCEEEEEGELSRRSSPPPWRVPASTPALLPLLSVHHGCHFRLSVLPFGRRPVSPLASASSDHERLPPPPPYLGTSSSRLSFILLLLVLMVGFFGILE